MLANGDMFEGHWQDGLKHGPGTFFFLAKACRYDGVWHQGSAKCGSYSEVHPAPPGARGALPNLELCDPGLVLAQAEEAWAALGAAAGGAAVTAGAAAAAACCSSVSSIVPSADPPGPGCA